MKKIYLIIATFLLVSTAAAQNYGVSLKVSTVGASVHLSRSFGEKFNVRTGYSYFSYSANGGGSESDDYAYDGKLELNSIPVLADWFPWGGVFRMTGGLFINLNKGTAAMSPTKTYTVGGDVYTPEKLGSLDAEVTFNRVSPYFGFGWGNTASSGLGFSMDVGAIYHGSPKVALAANGLLAPSASQSGIIENNLNWFQFYPVVSLGLSYNF